MSYQERLKLLKQTTGVLDEDVEEYEKNEVVRNAIQGVKKNAAINDAARTSP